MFSACPISSLSISILIIQIVLPFSPLGYLKWPCLTIKSFPESWGPNFPSGISELPWGMNEGLDSKCRGGYHFPSKAMVCHTRGKTFEWDLALVLMSIFLTNSLSEKAIERLRAMWWERPCEHKKETESMCVKVIWVSFCISSISLLWAVDFSGWQ